MKPALLLYLILQLIGPRVCAVDNVIVLHTDPSIYFQGALGMVNGQFVTDQGTQETACGGYLGLHIGGDEVILIFNGTAIYVAFLADSSFGNMNVTLDGQLVQQVNTQNATANASGPSCTSVMFQKGPLSEGRHTVSVIVDGSGGALHSFAYTPSGPPIPYAWDPVNGDTIPTESLSGGPSASNSGSSPAPTGAAGPVAHKSKAPIIVGVVCGALALTLLIILSLVYRFHKRRKHEKALMDLLAEEPDDPRYTPAGLLSPKDPLPNETTSPSYPVTTNARVLPKVPLEPAAITTPDTTAPVRPSSDSLPPPAQSMPQDPLPTADYPTAGLSPDQVDTVQRLVRLDIPGEQIAAVISGMTSARGVQQNQDAPPAYDFTAQGEP